MLKHRFWYCVVMVSVLCWYGFGMDLVFSWYGFVLFRFDCGMLLVRFWYEKSLVHRTTSQMQFWILGLSLLSERVKLTLGFAILSPRGFTTELSVSNLGSAILRTRHVIWARLGLGRTLHALELPTDRPTDRLGTDRPTD